MHIPFLFTVAFVMSCCMYAANMFPPPLPAYPCVCLVQPRREVILSYLWVGCPCQHWSKHLQYMSLLQTLSLQPTSHYSAIIQHSLPKPPTLLAFHVLSMRHFHGLGQIVLMHGTCQAGTSKGQHIKVHIHLVWFLCTLPYLVASHPSPVHLSPSKGRASTYSD